jgi:hypothetical protein
MFPTFPKIFILVLIIGVIWWWHRRNQIKAREQAELDRNARTGTGTGTKNQPVKPVEDMAKCRVCGAYVAAKGAGRCGRADCPF